MLGLALRGATGTGTVVTFVDAAGSEHVVVLSGEIPADEAPLIAREKLERWQVEGRAMFVGPLEFVKVI